MPTQTREFKDNPVPDINTGMPWGRGFFHTLEYKSTVDLAIADQLDIRGKVPGDEHWYILQWQVDDKAGAGGLPQTWQQTALMLNLPRQNSPLATPADPQPSGPWSEVTREGEETVIWSRWWDGATPIAWEDPNGSGPQDISMLTVRCVDPVWSMPRWEPGLQWLLMSRGAGSASGGSQGFSFRVAVLRFRTEAMQFRRLEREQGFNFILDDIHMQQHRPILGQ